MWSEATSVVPVLCAKFTLGLFVRMGAFEEHEIGAKERRTDNAEQNWLIVTALLVSIDARESSQKQKTFVLSRCSFTSRVFGPGFVCVNIVPSTFET